MSILINSSLLKKQPVINQNDKQKSPMKPRIKKHLVALFLLISIWLLSVQSIHVNYKKDLGVMTLFLNSLSKPEYTLHFIVDFTSPKLILSQSLKKSHQDIYLNKHKRNKLLLSNIIQSNQQVASLVEYRDYSGQNQQVIEDGSKQLIIDGVIGLLPQNNAFMMIVKESLNHQKISMLFGADDNAGIQILNDDCQMPTRLPIRMSVRGYSSVDLVIQNISSEFRPESSFVKKITGKSNNPFILTEDEYLKKIKLQINTKVKQVTVGHLLHKYCSKITASQSYECEIIDLNRSNQQQSSLSQYGSLPFAFDFSICQRGVQVFSNSIEPEQTYYWLHCMLLLVQFLALMAYMKQDEALKIVKNFLKRKKY